MKCKCGEEIKIDYSWGYLVNGERISEHSKTYKAKIYHPLNVLKYYVWRFKQMMFWKYKIKLKGLHNKPYPYDKETTKQI